ncbi:MAG: T9SS type A sorting domain-containing protein [Saprospiraceae bacterium]|nr:T9SS type A sorting domain-containing protein [Saprospiraceae bacterium]
MKKLKFFLFFICIFSISELMATHYMGGEISWECTSNGNFRFEMKLYRECYTSSGSAAIFGSSYPMYTTVPGFTSINMTILSGWPKDIAPQCNPDPSLVHIWCDNSNPMPNAAPNLGAVQEYYYTSDASYPNGVPLTGVPPASGWMFYYSGCCRNPCTNFIGMPGFRLRAIMYPYNNQNVSTCFDNSPNFAELSLSVLCTGSPFSYNHNAYDTDLDSLSFSWGQPLQQSGNPVTQYATGYSWNNPLPGPTQNPNNIAATVNAYTGEISFTSFTNGAFTTSTKVTSYRGGIKLAEIWRDMQVVLINCGSNNKPYVPPPFQSVHNGPFDSYVDTINAGDYVSFFLGGTDFEFLPNGTPQTVTLEASGFQFGTNFTGTGCLNPPCATLNSPPPVSGMFGVGSNFGWQTSCDHLATPIGSGVYTNVYNFVIKITDDYCPIPASTISTITIVVRSEPDLPPPEVKCASVNNSGFFELSWVPLFNFSNTFNGYHIFSSNNPNGPYFLVDSISDYYQTTYIDNSGIVGNNNRYYYVKTSSGCHGGNNLSEPSDTITNIVLSLSNSSGYTYLNWNSILNSPTASLDDKFVLKRKTTSTNWAILDSVQATSYVDSTAFCYDSVYYKVEIYDTNGCFSSSNVKSIFFNNQPIVSFSGLNSNYCTNDTIAVLNGIPQGGTFTGTGITANTFNPSVGVGNYNIKYYYSNSYGCNDSAIQNVTVNPVTPANLDIIDSVCANSGQYIFTGTPAGGNINGPGISGGVFYSNLLGAGTYGYTYTYINSFGCISSAIDSLKVNPAPTINLSGVQSEYCIDDLPVTIAALPTGGTFNGIGITNGVFYPSVAEAGLHKIKYSYTNTYNCTNTDSINVTVYPLPIVTITGLNSSFCVNNPAIYLSGSPSGGTFSGNGVSSGLFDPSLAGTGDHNVTYTYTDIHGCTNSTSQNVHVYPLPIVSFSGLPNQLCVNAQAIGLSGLPAGGTFNGNGINGNNFNPFIAGVGSHNISYIYTDNNGCVNLDSSSIIVNPKPFVSFSGLNSAYCSNDSIVTLSGSPLGGTFEGPGITANFFNPSIGGGNYNIKYTYTNTFACTDSSIQNVIVNPVTAVSLDVIDSVCANTGPYIFMGTPAGGTVSGPGMSGGNFFPNFVGPGTYGFTYTYINNYGCISTASDSSTVNPIPTINLSGIQLEYCEDDPPITIAALPIGGTYDGVGISNGVFYPAVAGPGLHKIKYSFTNIHSCTNSDSIFVTVNPLPVVAFSGLNNAYCIYNPAINLSGSPLGGTFSGDGINSNIFDPLMAGVGDHKIKYTFTDIHGCTNSDSQMVHVFPRPTITINGFPNHICEYSPPFGLIGIPIGGIFSGSGLNGNSFIPLLAGIGSHNITYSYADTNGCANQKTQTIVVNPKPIVSYSGLDSAYCFSDTIFTLLGSPLGGTFTGDGISGNNFNPGDASPGFHSIKYSFTDSNSCSNFISQTVEIYPLPPVNLFIPANSCCLNGSIINLTGNPVGGTFSGNGVYANNFDPTLAGVGLQSLFYSFTDFQNCTNTDTAKILVNSVPTSYAGADTSMICSSAGTFIGGPSTSGLVYEWQPTHGLSDSTSSNPYASPIVSTVYTVSTTDTLTNCSSSDDISIILLNVPNVDLGKDTTICKGENIELFSSTNAVSYLWNTGDTSQKIIVSPKINTAYTLTISDGVCFNADTIEVKINSPIVELGKDTLICASDSILIDAGNNHDAYLWNTGDTSQSILVTSNGISGTLTYYVIITDEYCQARDSINVEYTKPKVELGPDIVLFSNTSVILDARFGYSSYLWSDGSTNRTLTVDSSGIGIGSKVFTVIVTDSFGCSNTDSVKVSFIEYNTNEIPPTNTIIIYPNPSDGQIVISITGKYEELNFEIFNSMGQLIKNGKIESNENYKQETLLDLSYLSQGSYSIKFKNDIINEIINFVIK